MHPHNNLLNRKQVSEYFGITYPTLTKFIKDGTISAYRLGKRKIYFKEGEISNALKLVYSSKKEVSND